MCALPGTVKVTHQVTTGSSFSSFKILIEGLLLHRQTVPPQPVIKIQDVLRLGRLMTPLPCYQHCDKD